MHVTLRQTVALPTQLHSLCIIHSYLHSVIQYFTLANQCPSVKNYLKVRAGCTNVT